MQNRYVRDIGDYVKLALLRALAPGYHTGVAWWLFPDEKHNGDGRHIGYLENPTKWRSYDPELYDGLRNIVASGERQVSALEKANFLADASFANETMPTKGTAAERRMARTAWLYRVKNTLSGCDLVFLDPDNGLETNSFTLGAVSAGKSVSLEQLGVLNEPKRTLVVYHHQTRRIGGHVAEIGYWADRLRQAGFQTVDAVRASPFSQRAFFILNATPEIRKRAHETALVWPKLWTWHPDTGSPESF